MRVPGNILVNGFHNPQQNEKTLRQSPTLTFSKKKTKILFSNSIGIKKMGHHLDVKATFSTFFSQ